MHVEEEGGGQCFMHVDFINSQISIARTTMARLPWPNSFLSPYEILPIAQENKTFTEIFSFYPEIVCCVYSLQSPHRGDSNEYTQHAFIV